MKLQHALPALLLCLNSWCFAAAPENLDGYIYYESGYTMARVSYDFAFVCHASGAYDSLYRRSTSAGAPRDFGKLQPSQNGTYTYRRLDVNTAELALQDGSDKRTLRFLSDLSGEVHRDVSGIVAATFRLAPLSVRSPLANCSNRSFASSTAPALTGFVIAGDTPRTVVIRAIGPGLAPFGITDFLRSPALTVVRSRNQTVPGTNNDWADENAEAISRTSIAVGAFPLPTASKDAALILSLEPGAYVAQVSSPDAGDSGQALIEVYMLP